MVRADRAEFDRVAELDATVRLEESQALVREVSPEAIVVTIGIECARTCVVDDRHRIAGVEGGHHCTLSSPPDARGLLENLNIQVCARIDVKAESVLAGIRIGKQNIIAEFVDASHGSRKGAGARIVIRTNIGNDRFPSDDTR